MKKFTTKLWLFILSSVLIGAAITTSTASAAFDRNLIMDDSVFNNSNSMNAAQIDAFLNSFPSSCISTNKSFSAPNVVGYNPSQGFLYGSNVSAGTIINNAAKAYDLNPQVILATLQKEQSLVTGGAGCHYETPPTQNPCPNPPYGTSSSCVVACQYAGGCVYIAMGYDCPHYCVPGSTGFSKQIIKAAWKLKFVQQRSLGNYNWNVQKPGWDNADDPLTSYTGYMTEGTLKRNASSTPTYFDGYRPVNSNSVTVYLGAGATASLYSYTPFLSGNQNFVSRFESWFGSTIGDLYYSCRNGVNIDGIGRAAIVTPIKLGAGQPDRLNLSFLNKTSTACIEAHTWASGQKSWYSNVATNHPAVNPANDKIISADTNGNGRDELILVKLRGGASGKIEVHTWDSNYQAWISNIATNHPVVNPANVTVIAGDTNGDGRDELILVKLRGGASGKIEVHTWNPGYQSWLSNIATNHPAVDPANNDIIAANTRLDGDNRDKLRLIKYRNNGSGKIEIHTWNPGYQSWYNNAATNHPAVDPANNAVISADTDGIWKDELIFIKYRSTGSGKIEIHTWNPYYNGWYNNIATNHPAVDPARSYLDF